MVFFVRFPKVAANIEEGMVGRWLKHEGDAVAVDEPLVELVTDKAAFELTAEIEGTLLRIFAAEKSTVPVDYVLAAIGEPAQAYPDPSEENARLMALQQSRAAADWDEESPAKPAGTAPRRVRATPSARRLARENGVEISAVTPADGKVVRDDDVRRHLDADGPGAET